MPEKRISEFPSAVDPIAADDLVLGVDVSDTSTAAGGNTIKITAAQLAQFIDSVGLAAHLSDASDAHDASAVSVVPTGALTATNVQDALAQIMASIGAPSTGAGVPALPPTSAGWGLPGFGVVSSATMAAAASRLSVIPLTISTPLTITGAAMEITAYTAATRFRVSLYEATSGDPAGATLVATLGELVPVGTGATSITGLSVNVQPGRYWLALHEEAVGATYRYRWTSPSYMNATLTNYLSAWTTTGSTYGTSAPATLPTLSAGYDGSKGFYTPVVLRWVD